MRISSEQVAAYRRDGFTVVEDILTADELQQTREHIEGIAEGRIPFPESNIEYEPGTRDKGRSLDTLRKINEAAPHDAFVMEYARHPGIMEVVTALLGPDIKLFGDQTFMKPPGGVEKPYHQDSAYFKVEPADLVTAWMALDDVTLENGCLWVVPGSHLQGIRDHSQEWVVGDRTDKQVPDEAIDLTREVPITLARGKLLVPPQRAAAPLGAQPYAPPAARAGRTLHELTLALDRGSGGEAGLPAAPRHVTPRLRIACPDFGVIRTS